MTAATTSIILVLVAADLTRNMTSYAPVTVTGSALQGPQQQQPPEGARFNGTGGVRRGWWWQAGPVDS